MYPKNMRIFARFLINYLHHFYMNQRVRKTLKIFFISISSIIALMLIIITIVINFIFTPEKLTPMVLKLANKSLNADLKIEAVELTFFSTFPQFGLKIDEGCLISKVHNDTLYQPTDSLLHFKECILTVNPIDYLIANKISIHNLTLSDAYIHAYRDSSGIANWDIVKESLDEETIEEDDTTSTDFNSEIEIQKIQLKNTNIIFDDRTTQVYTRIDDANLLLRLALGKINSSLSLDFKNKNILFWQQGELLVNNLATSMTTKIDVDRSTATWSFKDMKLGINDIELKVNGDVRRDTLNKTIDMDLSYGLYTPSVTTALNLIPEAYIQRSKGKTDGKIDVNGTIK